MFSKHFVKARNCTLLCAAVIMLILAGCSNGPALGESSGIQAATGMKVEPASGATADSPKSPTSGNLQQSQQSVSANSGMNQQSVSSPNQSTAGQSPNSVAIVTEQTAAPIQQYSQQSKDVVPHPVPAETAVEPDGSSNTSPGATSGVTLGAASSVTAAPQSATASPDAAPSATASPSPVPSRSSATAPEPTATVASQVAPPDAVQPATASPSTVPSQSPTTAPEPPLSASATPPASPATAGSAGNAAENKQEVKSAVQLRIVGDKDKGVILEANTVPFQQGETVMSILKRVTKEHKIQAETRGIGRAGYVEGIANLYEFDKGSKSGWMYKVNGKLLNNGAGEYLVNNNDIIEWLYTLDLGKDLGGNPDGAAGIRKP